MNWQDFFKSTIIKETFTGSFPYFQLDLRVPDTFSIEELLMENFLDLNLTEDEKKHFNMGLRKIYLRLQYFKGREFERIAENFIERVSQEKEPIITFSSEGAGVYLLLSLLKKSEFLSGKKLICYTSEYPLNNVLDIQEIKNHNLHFIMRPHGTGYFREFPTLWHQSNLIDLFHSPKA